GEHARGEVEPPPHTARICLRGSVGGVRELETLKQLRRAAACLRAGEPKQAPEHLEVLTARQQLVDGRELTRQGSCSRTFDASATTSRPSSSARPASGR